MNTKSNYAKCSQCNELTWNDEWYNIYDKIYCNDCAREMFIKRIKMAIEYLQTCNPDAELYTEDFNETYMSNYDAMELLDILTGDRVLKKDEYGNTFTEEVENE